MTDTPITDLPKAYEPSLVEDKWYKFWMDKGYFKPVVVAGRKPFVIIMPPPNVTGELHLGHALTATLEDINYRHPRNLKRAQIEQLRVNRWLPEHRNCLITGSTGLGIMPGARSCRAV